MPRFAAWIVIATIAACLAVVWAAAGFPERVAAFHTDVVYFRGIAVQVLSGSTPYVDFALEYPPLFLLPAIAPYLLTGLEPTLPPATYHAVFSVLQVAAIAGVGGVTLTVARTLTPARMVSGAAVFAAMTLPLVLILPWRYDAVPAFLGGLVILLLVHRRHLATGALTAVVIATKLYPILWVPMILGAALRRNKRAGSALVVGGLTVAAAVLLAFASSDPFVPLRMFDVQVDRALHVESTWGSIVLAADAVGIAPSTTAHREGHSWEAFSTISPVLIDVQPLAFIGLIASVTWIGLWSCWRADAGTVDYVVVVFLGAVTAAFLLTNKIISPHHMFWLLPFVAIAGRRVQFLAGGATILTGFIYPFLYAPLLEAEIGAVMVLLVRNAALGWLLIELCRDGMRAATDHTVLVRAGSLPIGSRSPRESPAQPSP